MEFLALKNSTEKKGVNITVFCFLTSAADLRSSVESKKSLLPGKEVVAIFNNCSPKFK